MTTATRAKDPHIVAESQHFFKVLKRIARIGVPTLIVLSLFLTVIGRFKSEEEKVASRQPSIVYVQPKAEDYAWRKCRWTPPKEITGGSRVLPKQCDEG